MLYNKKILVAAFGILGLAASLHASEFTTLLGDIITERDIKNAMGITSKSLGVLRDAIKRSDLDEKIVFALRQLQIHITPNSRSLLKWDINAETYTDRMDFYGMNLRLNPSDITGKKGLYALGLHEQYHIKEGHPLINRYHDDHDKSAIISAGIGTAVTPLPILRSALSLTKSSRAPIKSAVLLGVATGLLAYKGFERRKILERRSQEVGADKYMLEKATPEITEGAIQEFTSASVAEALSLAAEQRQLHKQVSYMPARFINTYVVGRTNWYREHESAQSRLKRVVQSRGSDVTQETRTKLVEDVVSRLCTTTNIKNLSDRYSLPEQQVKHIIKMSHESCIDAIA